MTAYTRTVGSSGMLISNCAGGNSHRVRVSIPEIILALGIAGFTAADTLTIRNLPKGTFVRDMPLKVLTAEGATCTLDIGDGDDADGYHDAVDINAAAGTLVRGVNALTEAAPNTPTGYTFGKLYTADGVLIITFNHSTVNLAVFDLYINFDDNSYSPALLS